MFDNVEDMKVLMPYWPVASHGNVILTSRQHNTARQLVKHFIELQPFPPDQGAELLMHLLSKNYCSSENEEGSAQLLSIMLGGHSLAISQMAAIISAKSISVNRFLTMYKKSPHRIHQLRKEGWAFHGYSHALDTVWKMSFDLLGESGKSLLGLLCFLSPDEIPQQLLEPGTSTMTSELSFLGDEFE